MKKPTQKQIEYLNNLCVIKKSKCYHRPNMNRDMVSKRIDYLKRKTDSSKLLYEDK